VIDAINQKNAEINKKIQLLKLSQEIEKAERLKRKEAEKNQAESDKLGMEHKLQQMLKEQQTQNQALMEKLKDANGKAEKYMEICSKCRSDRHRVADCPLNFCKSCGEQGHEVIIFFRTIGSFVFTSLAIMDLLKFSYAFSR
jgi:hypothetical protein